MNFHVWSPGFTGFGGGIGAFSREVAKGLHALGHDVRLVGKMDTVEEWQGLPLWGAARYPSPLRTTAFAIGAIVAAARHRPDHLISTHVNFGPAAHWVKRAFGTPFTLVAHGIDVHDDLPSARRAALRAADRVFAVSAWTRQRVLGVGGIDPARVAVLPNTVDEIRFTVGARPDSLAKRYNLQAGERVVLTVARLDSAEKYKGCDRILQALPAVLATCGPVRFLVAGTGDDITRLEAMARDLGVRDAVTFAGFVADDELADHYRLADVFAMPSTGEGFGIAFLEAMACGTPVLAGNVDGAADALDGGRLGMLVNPTNTQAIAEGISALLKRRGPDLWFDPYALHAAVAERFGRLAFRQALRDIL